MARRRRHPLYTYLNPESTVWEVVLPFSFSSRLILVAAAESPINKAKIGSATLEIMYVGAGILTIEISGTAGVFMYLLATIKAGGWSKRLSSSTFNKASENGLLQGS